MHGMRLCRAQLAEAASQTPQQMQASALKLLEAARVRTTADTAGATQQAVQQPGIPTSLHHLASVISGSLGDNPVNQ